ncbi:transcriptional regulator [Actinoplanes sp. ATCC 53533]|uniref:helix-turn-helix transcriptional regulator n=1 Tax=Actinoplanes sp. ATCC 53533 TaxID=1288362 RepID=UPI000F793026|nr:transcriptional regulator [Actinoplanes sp. ATCC 53533]RSM69777.1 transcriptional regulator [Actinoplanes sp. ATCC 53533]
MPAGRLLSMLLLLQTRGRLSAGQLAAELGISVRTAYRDLARLQAAGVPLYAETGQHGGYRLVEGYRTRLTGLSGGEARALFLAGLPAPAADLGLAEEVAAARLKLLAALPAELRDQATRTAAVFHLDAPGWYQEAEAQPHLTVLMDAVVAQHAVDVGYRRWRAPQEVRRRLRPYGLVLKSGTWYLVAATGDAGRVATYRVAQVREVTVTAERFARPAGFDLAAHWSAYLAEFEARRFTGVATIRLSADGLARLPELADPAVVRAVAGSVGEPGGDGWAEATIPIENVRHACERLLPLGAEVEVTGPPELRQAMAAIGTALARRYGPP